MYISKIRLVNFIGIYIGQGCETFEIEMDNRYPITLIKSPNGFGKSVLLSSLSSPFAYDGGIDNRSNINIIRTGYLGEKEITYVDGKDVYFIHHYYKPNQNDSHSVKSYITKNGIELNPNGNVSSFEQIIQSVFGITQKDLMMSRLGTNTVSFSSMSSMDRKKYLSRIIGDIDSYMTLFREIQSDIRVNREMINKFTIEMGKLRISDIDSSIQDRDDMKEHVNQLLINIGKLQNEMDSMSEDAMQDTSELLQERSLLSNKISFIQSIDPELKKKSIDDLRKIRSGLEQQKNQTTTKLNQIKANIDSNTRGIEFSNIDLKKLEIDDTLTEKIAQLERELSLLKDQYKKFHPNHTSTEYSMIYQKVTTIRTWMTVIVGYETNIITKVLELYQSDTDLDQWVDQSMSGVVDLDTKQTMNQHLQQLLKNGYHITDCQDVNCVYRKIGEMIQESDQSSTITLEFIQDVQKVYKTYVTMIMEIRQISSLPKQLSSILSIENMNSLLSTGEIFSLDLFDQYRQTLLGYESYQNKLQQMSVYREQESSKNRLIVLRGEALKRIETLTKSNESLQLKLSSMKQELFSIEEKLSEMDVKIGKRLEYDNVKSLLSSHKKRIQEIDEKLERINSVKPRMEMLSKQMQQNQQELSMLQQKLSDVETNISLYTKYQSDIVSLGNLIAEQQKILRNVSPKDKGIPLLYMRRFFDKIRIKCNELLDITYDGTLKIGEFDPSSAVFDIPYIKNGIQVRDVKLSSQGERPLIDIALEFAMSSMISNHRYNILCCDELDSTLDYKKKQKYPEMLDMHISTMGIEQCFVISHSEVFNTIPCNLISMEPSADSIYGMNEYTIERT